MTERFESPPLREDLIRDLRKMAESGAGVRELVRLIDVRLGCKEPAVIPTLAYFCRAFCLPLPVVLPLREWLGTESDEDIDRLLLPEIEKSRESWSTIGQPVG